MIGSVAEGDARMGGKTARMPSVFLGHGTPLNALADNRWTQTWARVGREIGRPKAIVAISGHWCTYGVGVTAMAHPPTIHDFGGFPQALFDIRYPAPGDPQLAARLRDLLAPIPVVLDEQSWGLDHGTWSVLCKAYPAADIPVVQLSIDATQPPHFHFDLGAKLAPLRDEGVLILGSGNIVHNLRRVNFADDARPFDWAVEFDTWVKERLQDGNYKAIVEDARDTEAGRLSIPTPDHWYPLLYTLGAADDDEPLRFDYEGIENASISMRCLTLGA